MKFRKRFHRSAMCLNFADPLHKQLIDCMTSDEECQCKQKPSNEPESYSESTQIRHQIDEVLPIHSFCFSSLIDIQLAFFCGPFVKAAYNKSCEDQECD